MTQISTWTRAASRPARSMYCSAAARRSKACSPKPTAPLTADDLAALNDEIAAMARAGLPLDQGLASLAKEMGGGRLQAVTKLRGRVEFVAKGALPSDGKTIADERPAP